MVNDYCWLIYNGNQWQLMGINHSINHRTWWFYGEILGGALGVKKYNMV